MKKFYYALMIMLMALVSLGFTACSDDDEPNGADIVGTWQYNHPDDEEQIIDYDLFYQFTKDGKFHRVTVFHEPSYGRRNYVVSYGTYVVSGTKLIITFDGDEVVTTEGYYSVRGDILIFLGGDEPTFTRVEDSIIEPYL